jgi:ABC-type multidrug transport system ATPase subunit
MKLKNVSKDYKNKQSTVFCITDVNFEIKIGKITGLIGPNGSGKTTLIKIAMGLLKADKGCREPSFVKGIGLLREGASNLFDLLTVKENMAYFSSFSSHDMSSERMIYLYNQFGMDSINEKVVARLSRGQRQRVGLAIAFLLSDEYCILDEPTIGLDANMLDRLKQALIAFSQKNIGILLVSHDMTFVEDVVDSVYIMMAGKIKAHIDMQKDVQDQKAFVLKTSISQSKGSIDNITSALDHDNDRLININNKMELLQALNSIDFNSIKSITKKKISLSDEYGKMLLLEKNNDKY